MKNNHSITTIAGREIGAAAPVFIIAEIGVNHDGSLRRALELVRAASLAGADAVKLQLFSADALMHPSCDFAGYQQRGCREASAVEMLRRYELDVGSLVRIVAAIREEGMVPLATPFSPRDVATAGRLKLPAIKIASPDVVNRVLLERAATLRRPMIVSTGAATIGEVRTCVEWLRSWGTTAILMHCTSSYPAALDDANLCWIGELREAFGLPVGFSDHVCGSLSGALAVVAGAVMLERHLTHDRAAAGPDHAASSDPEEFAAYVRQVRMAERLRGRGGKHVLPAEHDVRRVSRQSLCSAMDLNPGDVLSADRITVRRPGTGICASRLEDVAGRRVNRAIAAGELLDWDMFTVVAAA